MTTSFKFLWRVQITSDYKAFEQMNIECEQLQLQSNNPKAARWRFVFSQSKQSNSQEDGTNYDSIVEVFRKLGNNRPAELNLW